MSAPSDIAEESSRNWGRIVLIGAGFQNRGAEAMVLTAVAELSERYPAHEFVVASYADREGLPWGVQQVGGRRFELVPNRKSLSHLWRVPLHAVARHTPLGDLLVRGDPYLSLLAEAAFVADISGFALTDQRPFWRRLVYGFEIFTARCFGRPFIVFTQALGPFRRISTWLIARTMLPRVALVIARGDRSRSFLSQLGIDRRTRVEQCADGAYLFPPSAPERGRELLEAAGATTRPLVGIVPNVNIFDRYPPRTAKNPYIHLLRELCDLVSRELEATPVLVCHEEHPGRLDDRWIAETVATDRSEAVPVVVGSISASDLKAVVGELDLVIASRFHSVVAAISMRTPVVVYGWAHKYAELMAEAELQDLVLDAREIQDRTVLELVTRAWAERDSIRERLHHVPDQLEASARKAFDHVVASFPPDRSS